MVFPYLARSLLCQGLWWTNRSFCLVRGEVTFTSVSSSSSPSSTLSFSFSFPQLLMTSPYGWKKKLSFGFCWFQVATFAATLVWSHSAFAIFILSVTFHSPIVDNQIAHSSGFLSGPAAFIRRVNARGVAAFLVNSRRWIWTSFQPAKQAFSVG